MTRPTNCDEEEAAITWLLLAAAAGEGGENLQQMASGFSELTLNKLGNQKQKCIRTRKNIFECSNQTDNGDPAEKI